MRRTVLAAGLAIVSVAASGCGIFEDDEPADLQVYTARHYDLEKAFDEFTEETGITVEFLDGDDAELLERLKKEGEDSPADIFMTVDAGNLWNAADQGQFRALTSPVLDGAVPADLRDPDGQWYGLAMRARTVVYNPDEVDPAEIDATDSYAALGDPKWRGRVCMRDATASYTQSLVASLIDLRGRERALEIVKSWMANDTQIMSNDIELLDAIDAGACDIGISNHYYVGRQLDENPDYKVKVFWASQEGEGTHVNISGAGVTRSSDNAEDAQKLLEWLATDGQSHFVDGNFEFPVNPEVAPMALIASWGEFQRMPVDAKAYGSLNADAVALLGEADYE